MRHVDILDKLNFDQFKSQCKASDVFLAVDSYRFIGEKIDQPFTFRDHRSWWCKSWISEIQLLASRILLSEGIGDTLRISLAP